LSIAKDKLADMYEKMMLTRIFEETAAKLFTQGKVHGTAHFCIGEEATGIGVCAALEPQDQIYATHRGHGQSIGKGMDVKRMMAEFLGKATGVCRGKGGCMHIAELAVGNLGANGIVAGGIPIAVGSALSAKMQGLDRVVVDFFGDGAANEGSFHEALNLASIWKLPVLFVCVNNQYGMSMHRTKVMNIENISERAASYGIPGKTVDGNDVLAVYEAVLAADEYARSGQGPSLIDCFSYRWRGHSKSDRNLYRTHEEIDEWKQKCPIRRFKKVLVDAAVMTSDDVEEIDHAAKTAVDRAAEEAQTFPEPSPENMEDEVYAK